MASLEVLAHSLEKPELDDRSYRVIKLPNQLEALIAHDPETDKASASVNVNVGSFSDADDMPGMAHAVEHLLFMGTKKYPVENAYSQYLSAHAGYSNAYTAPTETNYFFEVAASAEHSKDAVVSGETESPLRGALDRFAQFFISPLFLAETLNRELKAVDSENKKNLQSDTWRLSQLDKALSNPKHPYHHFSTGNLTSLRDEPLKRGVDLRKAFIDFHTSHYSANRMKLVVVGKESLDELQSWVVELFSDVKNKDLPMNIWPGQQPYTKDTLLKQIFAKPVMDTRSLEVSFSYRNEDDLYETHPSHYISHLIGHEGPGSILAYIKAKGWANGLSAGGTSVCPNSGIFTVSVRLTPDGLDHYKDVTEAIFQYISLIKEAGPQEWVNDELSRMGTVDFRFKQKSPASKFASRLSSTMQKPIPRKWLLNGTRLIRKFDAAVISDALALFSADNFRIVIVSREYPGNWDQKERWYGTEYRIEDIPEDFLARLRTALSSSATQKPAELRMPHKNEFIPTRLTVDKKEDVQPAIAPKLIRKEKSLRVWWKKDDQFWLPKASLCVALRNPVVSITPTNHVKARLFCQLVDDTLTEYAYDAEISGLGYSLDANDKGLILDVCGYNDKMPVLLEKVLRSMRDLAVNEDRFLIMKEKLARAYRNWEFQQPFHQVGEFTKWLNNSSGWLNEQYLAELEHVTAQDIAAFIPQLLDQVHLEVFAHGNLYKEDALRMADMLETVIKPRALPETQLDINRNLILPSGSDYTFRRTLGDPANINNCIEYYLYVTPLADKELRAKTLLLGQLGDERGFDTLRTKEQLGYIVFTGLRMLSSVGGYRVIIQSERSPEYLEQRISAFLVTLGEGIRTMSSSDFEGHKRSIIKKRLEKLKNLDEEFSRFWKHISSNYFDFHRHEIDVEVLRSITQQDMVAFFDHYIHPKSPHRAKLSVHMVAQGKAAPEFVGVPKEERVEKVTDVLGKFLTTLGVEVNYERLQRRIETVDLSAATQTAVQDAMRAYLTEDAKMSETQIQDAVEQSKQLLTTTLPALGIELLPDNAKSEELAPTPEVKETTLITDVPAFKAQLQLSAAPTPVVDLTTFEELESKL